MTCAQVVLNLGHVPTGAPDIARMAQLVRSYGDLPLGVVDASVIAIAERLKLTDVGHPGPAPLHSRPAGVALRLREAHERLLADVRSVRVCGWRTLEG